MHSSSQPLPSAKASSIRQPHQHFGIGDAAQAEAVAVVPVLPAQQQQTAGAGVTAGAVVPLAALVPPVGSPAHSTLSRLLQQSQPLNPQRPTTALADDDTQARLRHGGDDGSGVHNPVLARTGSVLRRRVSASCNSHNYTHSNNGTSRRNTHDMQLNDDNDGKTECAADDGDVSTSTSTLSMPVPLTSTSNHHQHLRPPTPDHFIAVSPPSPPRSRPHRPSPAMIPAPQTDDSIVAHALLSRATSLPHSRASSHHASTLSPPAPVTTTPTPSPPLSSSFTPSNDHHSRVSCWSSGTAPHLSRSGTSVPSAELSSKDHMALAGWSWETSTATESIGTANAYPPPPSAHERQVRLPLTLDDLASGRPVVGHNGHGRRHESAPPVAASVAASDRPFSVWGVR